MNRKIHPAAEQLMKLAYVLGHMIFNRIHAIRGLIHGPQRFEFNLHVVGLHTGGIN